MCVCMWGGGGGGFVKEQGVEAIIAARFLLSCNFWVASDFLFCFHAFAHISLMSPSVGLFHTEKC